MSPKTNESKPFPGIMPKEKPSNRPISKAMSRLYDDYGPYGDRDNEFFSNFKYTKISGIGYEEGVTRRDPSKVLRVNGKYYVWYTLRKTEFPPVGMKNCDDEHPATDWDLSDIGYATSLDGFNWEEQGVAVHRPNKGIVGDRSLATPDVMYAEGKYYLIYQSYTGKFGDDAKKKIEDDKKVYPYDEYPQYRVMRDTFDYCCASMAWSDSPDGPWHRTDRPILETGKIEDWDSASVHDPYLLKYNGKYCIYYKAGSIFQNEYSLNCARHGVAMSDNPLGPYVKSEYNPVLLSGHETFLYPYKEGIVSIATFDGPEKNTAQYAPDGINFSIRAHLRLPPVAAGPFCPDAYADNKDGQGIRWGLCHMRAATPRRGLYLARFDCELSQKCINHEMKTDRFINNELTYFTQFTMVDEEKKNKFREDMKNNDIDTI